MNKTTQENEDGEDIVFEISEDVIIYTIEFLDLQTFLICHTLNRRIHNNLTNTFNCYRLWFNHFRSLIGNYVKEMENALQVEFKKHEADINYWRKRLKFLDCVDNRNVETVDVLSNQRSEFWFSKWSSDGKTILGCGENGFLVFEEKGRSRHTPPSIANHNLFIPGYIFSGVNFVYGDFSPSNTLCMAVNDDGFGQVYDLSLYGTKKSPFLDSPQIKDTDDFQLMKDFLENTVFYSSGCDVRSIPNLSIQIGSDDIIDDQTPSIDTVDAEFEEGEEDNFENNNTHNHIPLINTEFEEQEEEDNFENNNNNPTIPQERIFRNHEGLYHQFILDGYSKKPYFINDDFLLYIPQLQRYKNMRNYSKRTRGYEIMKIRIERMNRIYNSLREESNSHEFNEMNIHLDFPHFLRRMEIELGLSRKESESMKDCTRRIHIFNLEKTEKMIGAFTIQSGWCEDADASDTIFFVKIPSNFYDLIEYNKNYPKKKEEDPVQFQRNDESEEYNVMLSKLNYLYLDGPISQLEFVNNELYALHRPCVRDEKSERTGKIEPFYQLSIYRIDTSSEDQLQHDVVVSPGLEIINPFLKKLVTLSPTVPKSIVDDSTYYIFVDVSENFIAIGSESSVMVVWDRSTWKHVVTVTGLYSKPVSCVTFSPVDPRMFVSASDDGTIRVMKFRSEPVEHDPVLEQFLEERKMRERMEKFIQLCEDQEQQEQEEQQEQQGEGEGDDETRTLEEEMDSFEAEEEDNELVEIDDEQILDFLEQEQQNAELKEEEEKEEEEEEGFGDEVTEETKDSVF